MTDLLRRLVSRALGREALVQPVVGSRFGREPELLSESQNGAAEEAPLALPVGPAEGRAESDDEEKRPPVG